MALTPQERSNIIKAGVVVAILVALSIFAPGMGINDSRAQIVKLDRTLDEETKALEEMKALAESARSLQNEYNRLEPEVEALERRLPRTSNYDELFRDLNVLGAKSNIKFDSMQGIQDKVSTGARGAGDAEKRYEQIPMQINLHVDYHGLGRFINDVENGERFMRVDGLAVNNGTDRLAAEQDWSVQNIELKLSTFRFTERSAAAAPPTPTPTSGK